MNKKEFFAANWGAAEIHSRRLAHQRIFQGAVDILEEWWDDYNKLPQFKPGF